MKLLCASMMLAATLVAAALSTSIASAAAQHRSGPSAGTATATAAGTATAIHRATDEFQDPSWTSLPARSIYNAVPSCRFNADDFYQCYPAISKSAPADPDNPESYVNSAYWPAEQRPDIEVYAMNRYGYFYDDNCHNNSVHYCFYLDAKKVGYPISHRPAVGDLAVFANSCAVPGENSPVPSNCLKNADHDWYAEYVFKVFKNGAYIGTGGGAADNNDINNIDSGITETEISKNSDKYTEFIGLMPKDKKLTAPKHRRLEPSTQVRFAAAPTTDNHALKVHFWLNRAVSSVELTLQDQDGPNDPVVVTNVPAGESTAALPLSNAEIALFAKDPYVLMSYMLKVGSSTYDAPLVTVQGSGGSAPQPTLNRFRWVP